MWAVGNLVWYCLLISSRGQSLSAYTHLHTHAEWEKMALHLLCTLANMPVRFFLCHSCCSLIIALSFLFIFCPCFSSEHNIDIQSVMFSLVLGFQWSVFMRGAVYRSFIFQAQLYIGEASNMWRKWRMFHLISSGKLGHVTNAEEE